MIIDQEELDRVWQLAELRLKRKPLQQILKRQDFLGNDFQVNDQVLIPRSDTEMLVKYTIDHIKHRAANLGPGVGAEINANLASGKTLQVLDLGTGSGAIAISILTQLAEELESMRKKASFPLLNIEVCATDISQAAVSLAETNARKLLSANILTQLKFVQSDVWEGLTGNQFDVIVSNPPYLPSGLKKDWQPELNFEPELALISGEDGFDMYRQIFAGLTSMTRPGGVFLGEFHSPLAAELLRLAGTHGFDQAKLLPDLSGVNRYIQILL
jgi:release factor glutamine methyltransferase